MKTLELELKKDVLIVEIPRLADYEFINKECKYLKVGNEEIKLNASTLDKFEFLCKGSELTEEMASELVEVDYSNFQGDDEIYELKKNYIKDTFVFMSFEESFISAVESKKFHWLENPMPPYIPVIDKKADENYMKKYFEAEEKTFKNPLIFVKK